MPEPEQPAPVHARAETIPVPVAPDHARGAVRGVWERAVASPDLLAVAGLSVLATVMLVAVWGTWGDLDSDTGFDPEAGRRVADGDLPYRDFVYFYGPLAPALVGLLTLIGGSGFAPAVGLGLFLTTAIVVATYVLARAFVGALGAFLAAAITLGVALIPDNYSFVLPHTNAATLGMLFVLCLLLALWRFGGAERTIWLIVAGTCLGLTLLTKPEPAAAAVAAVLVWLYAMRGRGWSWRREGVALLAPALVVPVVVYGLFLTAVSPHRLFLENLYPVDVLRAGGDTLIRARLPLTLTSFAELAATLLLYAAGAAVLVLAARGLARPGWTRLVLLAGTALCVLLAAAAAVINPEALRHGLEFAYGWVPAGAALAVVYLVWRARRTPGADDGFPLDLAAAAALLALAATSYGGFFPHAPHPQMAVYAMPLAAIFIARLHLKELAPTRPAFVLGALWVGFLAAASAGLTLKDAGNESATVRGAAGALAETPVEAGLYRSAIDWIESETERGDPIFVAPLLTGLYTLTDRHSPLPEITMLPGALPDVADEQRAIERLEAVGVRLVITDRRPWPGYGQGAFGETFDRELAAWLRAGFERVATLSVDGASDRNGPSTRTLDVWVARGS